MRRSAATSALLLAAATVGGCFSSCRARSPYSYLVTPSGHMFRVTQEAPIYGTNGKKIGVGFKYTGETGQVAQITQDAEEIAAAVGPELQASGETALVVMAEYGSDYTKALSRFPSFNVPFALFDGGWQKSHPEPPTVEKLKGPDSLVPPADPTFPYDPTALAEAARAADGWVGLLESATPQACLDRMTPELREQAAGGWPTVVAERRKLSPSHRQELYRLQTRVGNAAGGGAVVQYWSDTTEQRKYIDRVTLVRAADRWRVAGYAIQPVVPDSNGVARP